MMDLIIAFIERVAVSTTTIRTFKDLKQNLAHSKGFLNVISNNNDIMIIIFFFDEDTDVLRNYVLDQGHVISHNKNPKLDSHSKSHVFLEHIAYCFVQSLFVKMLKC